MHQALQATESLWIPIIPSFDYVHRAATILKNEASLPGSHVQLQLEALITQMVQEKAQLGNLEAAIDHFAKVTHSYQAGLFHCYDIEGLPKTNNDLEQRFGRWRHHQRRVRGQKVAPSTAVTRGSVQLIAALATQLNSYAADELATVSHQKWRDMRSQLQTLQQKRVAQRQFRHAPANYLLALEQKALQLVLLT